MSDHTHDEDLHVATTLLQAAEERAGELEERIMELDERHAHWDSRVRAMVHAVDNQNACNRIKIGNPARFVHSWMDELLKESD